MSTVLKPDPALEAMICARIEAIRQAHANNLIEGLDAGNDYIKALIERAREPISDQEFERRELARLDAQYNKA